MEEISAINAGEIIGVTRMTIHNYVRKGLLPARRFGLKRNLRIKVDDLRRFAQKYGYKFDEEKLREFGK
jgi:hypothetical protein